MTAKPEIFFKNCKCRLREEVMSAWAIEYLDPDCEVERREPMWVGMHFKDACPKWRQGHMIFRFDPPLGKPDALLEALRILEVANEKIERLRKEIERLTLNRKQCPDEC